MDKKEEWKAILLIFSGRPDPQWILNKYEIEDFMRLWSAAGDSAQQVGIPSNEGYKGIRLIHKNTEWVVHDSIITCFENGKSISRKDNENKIENLLKSSAPAEIRQLLNR